MDLTHQPEDEKVPNLGHIDALGEPKPKAEEKPLPKRTTKRKVVNVKEITPKRSKRIFIKAKKAPKLVNKAALEDFQDVDGKPKPGKGKLSLKKKGKFGKVKKLTPKGSSIKAKKVEEDVNSDASVEY